MFCTGCGKELQEGWVVCPGCGKAVNQGGTTLPADSTLSPGSGALTPRTREELKDELMGTAFTAKGSVVLFYGASGISRDLERVLQPGEEIIQFYHANRNSLIGQIKSLKMFRDYMVCTSQRLLYIESGRMAFSLIPFFRKVIAIPYQEVVRVEPGKRLGIYSGKLIVEKQSKRMNFAMLNSKDAAELADYLMEKKRGM